MKTIGRIKPSKPISAFAAIVGAGFVLVGLIFLIPEAGIFGWIWTIGALLMTGFYLYNLFSKHGVAAQEFDVGSSYGLFGGAKVVSVEERLESLREFKSKGLISEKEYEEQRLRILSSV